jgi:purine-binding chemotaxis protein CheW
MASQQATDAAVPVHDAMTADEENDAIFDIINFSAQGASRQYLTFNLGAERYGLEILRVQEIIGRTDLTPLPTMPPHVRGVINLRGTVVPVVDLRSRFAMEERAYDKVTAIIVVDVAATTIGMVVDTVADVMGIPEEAIQETPSFAASQKIASDYIAHIAKVGNTMIVLLDADRVLDIPGVSDMAVGAKV